MFSINCFSFNFLTHKNNKGNIVGFLGSNKISGNLVNIFSKSLVDSNKILVDYFDILPDTGSGISIQRKC